MARKASGADRIYNLISVIMLVLTAAVICGVTVTAATSPGRAGGGLAGEPTLFTFPTETATLRGPTPGITWTPSPIPSPTDTATPSRTPIPSVTNTPTNTPTPTNTLTPTPTPTSTNTPTATFTPTRNPFDFVEDDGNITYTQNVFSLTGNNAGCAWTAIAGTVVNRSGAGRSDMLVQVTGVTNPGFNATDQSGSNPTYGPGGWEVYLANTIIQETFIVQLRYSDNTPAAAPIQVTTIRDCARNVALVKFVQTQDRATATPPTP